MSHLSKKASSILYPAISIYPLTLLHSPPSHPPPPSSIVHISFDSSITLPPPIPCISMPLQPLFPLPPPYISLHPLYHPAIRSSAPSIYQFTPSIPPCHSFLCPLSVYSLNTTLPLVPVFSSAYCPFSYSLCYSFPCVCCILLVVTFVLKKKKKG